MNERKGSKDYEYVVQSWKIVLKETRKRSYKLHWNLIVIIINKTKAIKIDS